MVGREQFKAAKKGLVVVNCARAGVINEEALVEALEEKIVAAVGIDVPMGEPEVTSPLFNYSNVVITPHAGADTFEAQDKVGLTIAQDVLAALQGEMPANAVNLPSLQEAMATVRPYLLLGETLGKMYYQLEKEAIQSAAGAKSANGVEHNTFTELIKNSGFIPVQRDSLYNEI